MILKRYSIAVRIGSVVGVFLALMLLLAFFEMRGLESIRKSLEDVVDKHHQRLQTAQEMRFLARHGAVVVRNILLVAGKEAKDHERSRFEQGARQYDELLKQLRSHQGLSVEERQIIDGVLRGSEITYSLWRSIADEDSTATPVEVMRLLQAEVRNHQWGLLDDLEKLVQMEQQLADSALETALENHTRIRSIMLMINVLAIGIGLFLMGAITASIVGPLSEISSKVDKIASGDFTTRIDLEQQDEIGQLAGHINRMVEKLDASEEELEEYRYHLEELIELRTGEINDQRERFVSVLIHDLKGPLVPIIGFSRLLQDSTNLPPEKLARYAAEIHASTTKLAAVIDQTTRSLREKRTAFSFDKEPFDVKELLYSVARNCLPVLKAEQIILTLNGKEPHDFKEGESSLMFAGDIGKIRAMLENLIGNAGKYAKTRIEVTLLAEDNSLCLTVDDDGCGIAEQFRRKIFEQYYQAPGSRDGTGVGLYSVRRTIDHYQGTISVATAPMGGARFTVTLPMS